MTALATLASKVASLLCRSGLPAKNLFFLLEANRTLAATGFLLEGVAPSPSLRMLFPLSDAELLGGSTTEGISAVCRGTEEEEEEAREEPLAVDRDDAVEVVLMRASLALQDPPVPPHSEARRDREARRMSEECREGVRKATCKY